jgi:hypothetical protein
MSERIVEVVRLDFTDRDFWVSRVKDDDTTGKVIARGKVTTAMMRDVAEALEDAEWTLITPRRLTPEDVESGEDSKWTTLIAAGWSS